MNRATASGKWFIAGVLFSLALSTGSSVSADDTWASHAPMSIARHGHAVGVVNGILYVAGGNASNNAPLGMVEAYDPSTNAWTFKASMSTVRSGLAVGVAGGVLYAVGGYNGNNGIIATTVEAYDPVSNLWSTKAPLPTARYNLAVGVVNGILYAVGGISHSAITATVEAYDPATNTWSIKSPMPTARHSLAVGVVNGILYAVGGNSNRGIAATVEAYNPMTDTWTTRAPMPTVRQSFAAGVVSDILYAVGGANSSVIATVEAYDPVTNTWTTQAPMPTARYNFAVGVVSPLLYAVGGNTSTCCYNIITTLEAYTAPITPPNLPPTAVPGLDQPIHVGQTVTLNGSDSFDDNTVAALLQYAWSFESKPVDSAATLVNPATATPSFVADRIGTYIVQLVVTDEGGLSGAPAYVTISSANIAPTAHAGSAQAAVVGQMVTLNGAGSSDPDGDALTYSWRFVDLPPGSVAVLAGAPTPTPSFTPDLPGQFIAGLIVSDGYGDSLQAQVTISVITAADYAQSRIAAALNTIAAMSAAQFKAPGHKYAISNLLTQAIAALQAGDLAEAVSKINAALSRTEGYPVRGVVDTNGPGMDWITDVVAQAVITQALMDALDILPDAGEHRASCKRCRGEKFEHHHEGARRRGDQHEGRDGRKIRS